MAQLEIPFTVSEETSDSSSLTNSVSEAKMKALQRFCQVSSPDDNKQCSVNVYQSGGSHYKRYFRLSYRKENKIKHLHIPGGNIYSPLAQYRAKQLREMIDRGAELGELIAAIETYRS